MKDRIVVKYLSYEHLCSQIITGLFSFTKESNRFLLKIEDHTLDDSYLRELVMLAQAIHNRKRAA